MSNLYKFLILALISVCLFAYFIYYNYFQSLESDIIIYPDYTENKVRPSKNDDSFQQNVVKTKKNDLLPEPEQPINISLLGKQSNDSTDTIDKILADLATHTENSSVLPTDEGNRRKINVIKITQKTSMTDRLISKKNNSKNSHTILLASVKSEKEAVEIWENIKKQHPKIMNNRTLLIKKIKNDQNKFYYVTLASGFENLSQANRACRQLIISKKHCTIYND